VLDAIAVFRLAEKGGLRVNSKPRRYSENIAGTNVDFGDEDLAVSVNRINGNGCEDTGDPPVARTMLSLSCLLMAIF
jgi:hypothetical protein